MYAVKTNSQAALIEGRAQGALETARGIVASRGLLGLYRGVSVAALKSMPLTERLAKGGWEENEELCVAYVAVSRARRRIVKLPHLDHVIVDAVKELFEAPVNGEYATQPDPAIETEESESEAADDARR